MIKNILILAALVIVILILRAMSEKRITLPEGEGGAEPEPLPDGGGGFRAFTGTLGDTEYMVDMLTDDAVTVEISVDQPLEKTAEIDARGGEKPELSPADPMRPAAEALLAMGAEYIDVGFNDDRVAADFPLSVNVDRAFAEKAARHLVNLRELAA